jgi:hypothetical protein
VRERDRDRGRWVAMEMGAEKTNDKGETMRNFQRYVSFSPSLLLLGQETATTS